MVQSTTSQLSAAPVKVDKRKTMPCRYGINCNSKACAFKHPDGWKAKLLISSNGQTRDTRKAQNEFKGLCHRCGLKGHMARDCKNPRKTTDTNSATVTVEALATNLDVQQTSENSPPMSGDWKIIAQYNTHIECQDDGFEPTFTSDDDITIREYPQDTEEMVGYMIEGNTITRYESDGSMPGLNSGGSSDDDSSSGSDQGVVTQIIDPWYGRRDCSNTDSESDAVTEPYESEKDSPLGDTESEADVDSEATTISYRSEEDLSNDNPQENVRWKITEERIPLEYLEKLIAVWNERTSQLEQDGCVLSNEWKDVHTPSDIPKEPNTNCNELGW